MEVYNTDTPNSLVQNIKLVRYVALFHPNVFAFLDTDEIKRFLVTEKNAISKFKSIIRSSALFHPNVFGLLASDEIKCLLVTEKDAIAKYKEGVAWKESKGDDASQMSSAHHGPTAGHSPTENEVRFSIPPRGSPTPTNGTVVSELTMRTIEEQPDSPRRWMRKGSIPSTPLLKVPEDKFESCWPMPYNREQALQIETFNLSSMDQHIIRREAFTRKQIIMMVVTWNQQAKFPTQQELEKLIPPNKYHVVAIGTQECEKGFAKSLVNSSKKNWEELLQETLGKMYFKLCSRTLQATHLIIFVNKSLRSELINVTSAAVPTGVGNRLGNKGGIGVKLEIGETTFLIITSHLAAHQGACDSRNTMFHRIGQDLHRTFSERQTINDEKPLLEVFDYVIWCGDLNYRINSTRETVLACLNKNMHEALLEYDQLYQQIDHGNCFRGFDEGALNFRPTYKFDKDSDTYDSSPKQRVPSWTDRILFKKTPGIRIMAYDSVPDIRTSDHRPVWASFLCTIRRFSDQNPPNGFQPNAVPQSDPSHRGSNKSEVCLIQ